MKNTDDIFQEAHFEIKKKGFEITARFPEDTKVISLSFLYKMKEVFGEGWERKTGWDNILSGKDEKQKRNIEDFWHLHFVKRDNKETGETSFFVSSVSDHWLASD